MTQESDENPKRTGNARKRKNSEGSAENADLPSDHLVEGSTASAGAKQKAPDKAKVSKTILENPVGNYEAYLTEPAPPIVQPTSPQTAPGGGVQTPSAPLSPPQDKDMPAKGRRVAKTIFENPIGNYDQYVNAEVSAQAPPEYPTEPPYQPAPAPPEHPTEPPYRPALAPPEHPTEPPYQPPLGPPERPTEPSYQPAPAPPERPTEPPYQPAPALPEYPTEPPYQPAPAPPEHPTEPPYQPPLGPRKNESAKVAKTRLENPVANYDRYAEQASDSTTAPEAKDAIERNAENKRPTQERRARRFSRTMLENPIGYIAPADALTSTPESQLPPDGDTQIPLQLVPAEERRSYVARTMLDQVMLSETLARNFKKRELKVQELAAERACEPPKEFHSIDKYKLASTCPWTWEESDDQERIRTCAKCQAQVYNFDDLELQEAQALIFKRENLENATLYKRADGKFMTSDCPLELKKRNDRLMLTIVGTMLVICAIALLLLLPRSTPTVTVAPPTVAPPPAPGEPRPAKTSSGGFHYEAGKVTTQPVQSLPGPAQNNSTTSTSDSDSNGQFWQYANPADANAPTPIIDPSVATPTPGVTPPAPSGQQPQQPGDNNSQVNQAPAQVQGQTNNQAPSQVPVQNSNVNN